MLGSRRSPGDLGQEEPPETWVRKSPQRLGSGRAPGDLGQEEPLETWVRNSRWRLGSGRAPGEGNGHPLQYCCLENSTDKGAWWATVHGVRKSQAQLSD